MINILEDLELQYLQTPANAFSKEEAKLSILEAEKTSDNYRMLVKHSTNESLDEMLVNEESKKILINRIIELNYKKLKPYLNLFL